MDEMTRAWRNDAEAKVTGRARYTDDLEISGVLHAVPVYAEHPRARLRGVDVSQAALRPGVVRVLTAKDVPGAAVFGQIQRDYPMFVSDAIRSRGDVVALVVAKTRAEAIAAIPFVRVDAEPLPAITDPEEALRDGARSCTRPRVPTS